MKSKYKITPFEQVKPSRNHISGTIFKQFHVVKCDNEDCGFVVPNPNPRKEITQDLSPYINTLCPICKSNLLNESELRKYHRNVKLCNFVDKIYRKFIPNSWKPKIDETQYGTRVHNNEWILSQAFEPPLTQNIALCGSWIDSNGNEEIKLFFVTESETTSKKDIFIKKDIDENTFELELSTMPIFWKFQKIDDIERLRNDLIYRDVRISVANQKNSESCFEIKPKNK